MGFWDYIFIFGEILLALASIGLIGMLIWVVMTALHVKNQTVAHAQRLTKRPLTAGKNLWTTGKGIAQQETVRVKRIGASAKVAGLAVKDAALDIKDVALDVKETAQSVHPENVTREIQPTLATLETLGKAAKVAVQLSQAAGKQKAR